MVKEISVPFGSGTVFGTWNLATAVKNEPSAYPMKEEPRTLLRWSCAGLRENEYEGCRLPLGPPNGEA